MTIVDRCGVKWGACPDCGDALLADDELACLRCARAWRTDERQPCPDPAVSEAGLCRAHAEHAKQQLAGSTLSLDAFRAQAPVFVVPYDERWPSRFEAERALLQPLLAPWLVAGIEHMGSTAIPGLAAKPVIDIMAPVESLEASRPALSALTQLAYNYFPYRADVVHWFCKPSDSHRTHHLHLVPFKSPLWNERIAFRDHLRAHPLLAAEYGELKRRLADEHRFDREAYTEAKGAFVQRVLKLALD
jgi:GrpB-like predicted nucleotidyltransferase (UPF0157 family)